MSEWQRLQECHYPGSFQVPTLGVLETVAAKIVQFVNRGMKSHRIANSAIYYMRVAAKYARQMERKQIRKEWKTEEAFMLGNP